ncbi:unnamed protein product [Discula destructiva]
MSPLPLDEGEMGAPWLDNGNGVLGEMSYFNFIQGHIEDNISPHHQHLGPQSYKIDHDNKMSASYTDSRKKWYNESSSRYQGQSSHKDNVSELHTNQSIYKQKHPSLESDFCPFIPANQDGTRSIINQEPRCLESRQPGGFSLPIHANDSHYHIAPLLSNQLNYYNQLHPQQDAGLEQGAMICMNEEPGAGQAIRHHEAPSATADDQLVNAGTKAKSPRNARRKRVGRPGVSQTRFTISEDKFIAKEYDQAIKTAQDQASKFNKTDTARRIAAQMNVMDGGHRILSGQAVYTRYWRMVNKYKGAYLPEADEEHDEITVLRA